MINIKNFKEIVENFNTTPILFIGSGISRRYLNTPDWKGLLEKIAINLKDDDFAYAYYENEIKNLDNKVGDLPKIAEILEKDFNEKWLRDKEFRKDNLKKYYDEIKNDKLSPFKATIGEFFINCKNDSIYNNEELKKFTEMCKNSITSIITTNYDCLLENLVPDFKKFIGQEDLIFANIQGIAEIYKIHGCASEPKSIVINENDYLEFMEKNQYLSSKLITLFMEYPIIFLGYSINDYNIKTILENMTRYLSTEKLKTLKDRLIFIERKENENNIIVSDYGFSLNNKEIPMTKIQTDNFGKIYEILSSNKKRIPVKILRTFKEELYQFILSNNPTKKLRVANIDNPNLKNSDLILAIGKAGDFALKGLTGLTGDEWYIHLILENLDFTFDELLNNTEQLIRRLQKLPLNKYLYKAENIYYNLYKKSMEDNNSVYSNTIKNGRKKLKFKNIEEILNSSLSLYKKVYNMCFLTEENTNIEELENFLKNNVEKYFEKYKGNQNALSDIRRLIRIYDYLKYADKVTEKYK